MFQIKSAISIIKNTQISESCNERNCSHAPAARRRKLTSCKDYTFSSLPKRITDFVRRARSQIKFSRDAGRRTIIKSKFAKNRRSVEKHLTNRNGVCRGTLCKKKRPRGPQQKSSRQARTLRPRVHATRYENLHFYVTKAALSLPVEIAGSSSLRLSEVLRVRRFSPVVRKTRTVILNSLGDSERDSGNTKQAWRSARRKTIYRRFQASLCENPCSNSLSTGSRAPFDRK